MPKPEFIRQGVAYANAEREFSAIAERAKWESEQTLINATCHLPACEIEGIAAFDLWFMFLPCNY